MCIRDRSRPPSSQSLHLPVCMPSYILNGLSQYSNLCLPFSSFNRLDPSSPMSWALSWTGVLQPVTPNLSGLLTNSSFLPLLPELVYLVCSSPTLFLILFYNLTFSIASIARFSAFPVAQVSHPFSAMLQTYNFRNFFPIPNGQLESNTFFFLKKKLFWFALF